MSNSIVGANRVALLVGAFIIFNTFSITVAQRTREFGLLRTLGGKPSLLREAIFWCIGRFIGAFWTQRPC